MEAKAGIYLTLRLGKEAYGIPVLKVQEIIGRTEITEVPRMPAFIKGVINLRGKIIPLMDLRLKFELEEKEYTDRTVFVVLEVNFGDRKRQMGIVVDSVSEVVKLEDSMIEPPPRYGVEVDSDFIIGMGKQNEKVIMLLDIEKVLTENEMAFIAEESKE
ncbi:MAG TPA: chemotaxis protein CheW [Thermotogota bacterium]|nr:chemotaxis protein CheW [Thermotogota bacterium]